MVSGLKMVKLYDLCSCSTEPIPPLTTYVIRMCEVKTFHKCSKFYCNSCSFQSQQKDNRCTKVVSIRTVLLHNSQLPISFLIPQTLSLTLVLSYTEVYLVKVFGIVTAFQKFTFIVKYCPFTSTFGAHSLLR